MPFSESDQVKCLPTSGLINIVDKDTAVQDRIEGHLPMVKTGALHQPGRDFQGEVCGFEL